MNFTLKVFKNGKQVSRLVAHSKRLFLTHLRSINWHNGISSVYLRVFYGKRIDNFGKLADFYNDGFYENKKDLWLAFEAFKEAGEDD